MSTTMTNSQFVAAQIAQIAANPEPAREVCYGLVTTDAGMTEYRPLARFGFAGLDAAESAIGSTWTGRLFVCGNLTAKKKTYKQIDPLQSVVDYFAGTVAAGRKVLEQQTGAFPGLTMKYEGGNKVFVPKGVTVPAVAAPAPAAPAPSVPSLPIAPTVPAPVADPGTGVVVEEIVLSEPVAAEPQGLDAAYAPPAGWTEAETAVEEATGPTPEELAAIETETEAPAADDLPKEVYFKMAVIKNKKRYLELTEDEAMAHEGLLYVKRGTGKSTRYVEAGTESVTA